jgi:two-component system, NtrC family, nitrogen regulation response regulator NtrX
MPNRTPIVDDDEVILDTLSTILQQNDCEAATATKTQDALKLMVQESFDFVLGDLHMPADSDGLTALSATHRLHPDAIAIIHSGSPDRKRAAAATVAQADRVFVKPGSLRDMVATIKGPPGKGQKP